MSRELYRYRFGPSVDIVEVQSSMILSLLAAESLHGEAVRLEAPHFIDAEDRTCVIESSSNVGRDLNRIFIGFIRREFSEDAFRVERVDAVCNPEREEVCV